MPENIFSPKMKGKSVTELQTIIDSHDYSPDAKAAATWELEERPESSKLKPDIKPLLKETGESLYKDFLKTVKGKSSFAWTPKHQELIKTELSDMLIFSISEEVFEKLEWEIAYYNGETIMAFRSNAWKETMQKISVTPDSKGGISIISESAKGVFDAGKNSKIVALFVHVFNEVLKSKTPEELAEREAEIQKSENWDDYEVPETLPKASPIKTPNPLAFVLMGLVVVLILGFLLAYAMNFVHVIFLYEVLIGIGFAFILVKTIRWTNFIELKSIQAFCIIGPILITIGAQYFTYIILLYENPVVNDFSFSDFIKVRFEQGFTIRTTNLGWYGWVGILILQPFLISAVSIQRVLVGTLQYMAERVPEEVIQFASYHFVKGKTEQEVRTELSMKGWSDKRHQDNVFQAIGSIQEQREFIKELS